MIGMYTIKYSTNDAQNTCVNETTGEEIECVRHVTVRDTKPPDIFLNGDRVVTGFEAGENNTYEDPGVSFFILVFLIDSLSEHYHVDVHLTGLWCG